MLTSYRDGVLLTTVDGSTTRELRRRVLRPHHSPTDVLPGDDRPDAVHVAALADDGELLGTCLVFAQPCNWRPESPAWILRSMAVDPDAQGRGIGRAVLATATEVARAGGAVIGVVPRPRDGGRVLARRRVPRPARRRPQLRRARDRAAAPRHVAPARRLTGYQRSWTSGRIVSS